MKFLLVLVLALSCAGNRRTKYGPMEKKEGYRDLAPEAGLRKVSFRANAHTSKEDAELFAKFRAIEVCQEAGYELTNIMQVNDASVSKEVLRTRSTGFPTYYYGMYPFYGRFHSGVNVGFSSVSSNTWGETYIFPNYVVTFDCTNKAMGPEVFLREVSAEDMKLLVKDLKGALQVEKIIEGSPNEGVLEVGDVILRAEGTRIQSVPDLLKKFKEDKQTVQVEIMREGERKKLRLRSEDVSEFVLKSQKEIVASACRKKEIKERPICTGKLKSP